MRSIEKHYKLSRSTLSRHWRDHVPELLDVDADTARDVKQTEQGIIDSVQLIREMNGFNYRQADKEMVNKVAHAIETLWAAFPWSDGPVGDTQVAIVRALMMLTRVQGREFIFDDGTAGDLRSAQEGLENWGRSGQE
jgi:hypothetical protein